jgi:cell division protein FtsW
VSAGALSLRRLGGGAKANGKGKKRARRAAASTEYNMLLTATLCLLALGAVMVFSASSTTRVLQNGGLSDSAFYLQRTVLFGLVGLLVMHVVARHGLTPVRRLTPLILAGSFVLLLAVLVIGKTVNGATSWIGSGFLQIQPSEVTKVALILYSVDLLARKPKMARSLEGLMPILLVCGASAFLIMLQPDLGTMLVLAFALGATLIAAGARPRDLGLIALGLGAVALLMALAEPYRMARLTSFLNPGAHAEGAGFQVAQAKIALGSGGLDGVGIGNGVQKAFYLPEAHTDMISAVIGEELGFLGILAVVGLFGMFGYAGLKVAQRARDNYGKLLVAGLTSLIVIQAMVNLYAVMGLAPLTGVPLPFVSYGNSSLLTSLFAVGLILNVARGGRASAAATGRGSTAKRRSGAARSSRSGAARSGTASRAGKLRVVEGGRRPAAGRSRSSGARKSKSGGGGRGNRGARRARHGGRRRASG